MSSFDSRGQLVLSDGRIIVCVGKKRSGKSVLARLMFDSYPGDRVVLDIAGDDGPAGPDVLELHGTADTLPRRWPEDRRPDDGRAMTLRYVPDAGSSTFLEDMDAVVGLALAHGRRQRAAGKTGCCLLVHEVGVLAPANRTPPHVRRALMHNRHNGLTLVLAGPRPVTIDPLVIQQADVIYTFELMNPTDRRRLAESMGWDPGDFDGAVHDLALHEYLRFDANEQAPESGQPDLRLIHFPALPADVVASVKG